MSKSRLFLLVLVIASFGVVAQAQMYSSSDYSFRGFYVGANVGGVFNRANTGFTPLPDAATFFDLEPTGLTPTPDGFMGGGQVGWNWVGDSRMMFGIEGDFQATASLSDTKTVTPIIDSTGAPEPAGTFLMAHQEMPWLGTLRARAGYVAGDRTLLYITGGLAYANVKWAATTDLTASTGFVYPAAINDNKAGWTVGAGFEFLATRHVAFGGEYLYYDLGDERIVDSGTPANLACPTCQVQYTVSSIGHVVRGKINFKF
jgi:outer membrane immunogenic protein